MEAKMRILGKGKEILYSLVLILNDGKYYYKSR